MIKYENFIHAKSVDGGFFTIKLEMTMNAYKPPINLDDNTGNANISEMKWACHKIGTCFLFVIETTNTILTTTNDTDGMVIKS